jgi:hypothetical protein
MVDEWLPWVHIAIANLQRFLLGTFHGTARHYLQNYLNEFCYRFNRRFWEAETPKTYAIMRGTVAKSKAMLIK